MKWLPLLLAAACGRNAADACVPGAGTPSQLAGSWLGDPYFAADPSVYLEVTLAGTPESLCGQGLHHFSSDHGGSPFNVRGNERSLDFGRGERYDVALDASTGFDLHETDGGRAWHMTRPSLPDACVPGDGPPSYLAGSWLGHPEQPSDYGTNLDLTGSAQAICGVATHWFAAMDAGYPTPVWGTEQSLRVDGVQWDVMPRDGGAFALGRGGTPFMEYVRR